jgi:hypothetical protein
MTYCLVYNGIIHTYLTAVLYWSPFKIQTSFNLFLTIKQKGLKQTIIVMNEESRVFGATLKVDTLDWRLLWGLAKCSNDEQTDTKKKEEPCLQHAGGD